jgi:myo-inositol-1(or 4)-monophosphatase
MANRGVKDMTPSTRGEGWMPVLLEAAENARERVLVALEKGGSLNTREKKSLLDFEAQAAIRESLTRAGKPAEVVSEEGDYSIGSGGDYVVLDPVDGTTNLARGIPLAVISLAVSETPLLSGMLAGLVMDLQTGVVFWAVRGKGAWRDGTQIRPSNGRSMNDALISIDISKGVPLELVQGILVRARHLRYLGCSAISLCYLASGVLDVHMDVRGSLRATDIAAGLLILKEAGGVYAINGALGGNLKLTRDSTLSLVAASCTKSLNEVRELLR